MHQFRPQVLDQLAHRLGDGFDVFEVEKFLVDAFDLSRVDDPAIEDALLVAGFFLVIAAGSCAGKCPRYRLVTSMVCTQKFSNLKSKIYCRKLGLIASYERIFWNA